MVVVEQDANAPSVLELQEVLIQVEAEVEEVDLLNSPYVPGGAGGSGIVIVRVTIGSS
jgi:hypothetical protein